MTSTASFKDKIKQIFSVFLWEMKACTGTLTVYSILAGVFTIIALTMSLVSTDYFISGIESTIPLSQKIKGFQIAASSIITLLTTIFTIFYTIKVYSYMHDKRKADFYGPLPISRARMYLSKTLSAYLFSVVPALFFISIIAIISVCTGTQVEEYVSNLFFNTIVGTLACVTSYGLVATCCGTTLNSVIMFLVVCGAYPLTMNLLTSIVCAFYPGFYIGVISDSFITTALCPLAAYTGKNMLYWLVFSILCIVGATVLIMKRKSERAQTSFAYYLPCHLVKLMVSFICGAFLGCIFAALNVMGYGLLGFIFGFLIASIPAYVITHLIFYKGFKKLFITAIPLCAMIVLVIGGSCVFNFDVFGYNTYIPDIEDIKSAGFIDSEHYMKKDNKTFYQASKKCSGDITDKELIADIISAHEYFTEYNTLNSDVKFQKVWISMLSNLFLDFTDENAIAISYKLNNGMTVSRYYNFDFSLFSEINESYNYNFREEIQEKAKNVFTQKEYILKYSGTANADFTEEKEIDRIRIFSFTDNEKSSVKGATIGTDDGYYDYNIYYDDDDDKNDKVSDEDLEKQIMMYNISQAFIKDLKADEDTYTTVLLDPYDDIYGEDFEDVYTNKDDYYNEDSGTYDWLSITDGSMLYYVNQNFDEDIVCQINISTSSRGGVFSTITDLVETFYIPSSYTNTLETLRNYGIIDENNNLNKYSEYLYSIN